MTAQLLQAKLKNHWTVKLKLTTQQSGRTAHKIEEEKRDQSMKKRKARDGKRDIKGEMVVKLSPKQSKLDF